jgi:hypothetical protein
MANAPFKNYGFNYEHNGKRFAFHVKAESEKEAFSKITAMRTAKLFGELKETPDIAHSNLS